MASTYRVHIEYISSIKTYVHSTFQRKTASISSIHTRYVLDIYSMHTTMQVSIKYISSMYRGYTILVVRLVGGLDTYSIYTRYILDIYSIHTSYTESISSTHTQYILDTYSIYTQCIPTMRVFIKYISSIYRGYILHVTRCPVGGINTINILDIYFIYTRFILDKYVFR